MRAIERKGCDGGENCSYGSTSVPVVESMEATRSTVSLLVSDGCNECRRGLYKRG